MKTRRRLRHVRYASVNKRVRALEESGYVKKTGKEKTIAEHAPKGWKYMGTYFYAAGFGPCTAAQFWECFDFADFDTWRNYEGPIFLKLWKQVMAFGTPEPTLVWLLREAGDSTLKKGL